MDPPAAGNLASALSLEFDSASVRVAGLAYPKRKPGIPIASAQKGRPRAKNVEFSGDNMDRFCLFSIICIGI
jgi:hypothetical protein